MKKLIYAIAIVGITLSATSCKKEEITISVFNAAMENFSSNDKTYFESNIQGGGSFWWKSNDNFKIWTGANQGRDYDIQMTAGHDWQTIDGDPNGGSFAQNNVQLVTTEETALSGPTFYAFYPGYKSDWTGEKPTVVLDANQVLDNFDPDGFAKYNRAHPGAPMTEAQYAAARVKMVNLKRFPMYAKTEDNNLQFKHLCGALMVKLEQTGKTIRSIEFTTQNQKVSGTFGIYTNVAADGATLMIDNSNLTEAEKSTKIEFSYPVSIGEATMFWLRLPPATYTNFTITITDGDYKTVELTPNGGTLTIERAVVTPIDFSNRDFTYTTPEGLGIFTVALNSSNQPTKKVYFSPGNLQYTDNHWKFADEQYEVIHGYSGSPYTTASSNYNQDLFGWSTTNSAYGQSTTSSNYIDGNLDSPFIDWGGVFGDNTWYTMPIEEWEVLLHKRPTSFTVTVNGVSNVVRWAAATVGYTEQIKHNLQYSTTTYWVDGIPYIYNPDIEDDFQRVTIDENGWIHDVVYFKYPYETYEYIYTKYTYNQDGILIFPDNFTSTQWQQVGANMPNNAINNIANHPDSRGSNMDFVFLSMAQLNALEEMGVVWLPAAGRAALGGNIASFENPQNGTASALYYWTASPYTEERNINGPTGAQGESDDAFQLYIHNNGGAYGMNGQSRTDRCAVRLVRQAFP